MKKKNNVLKDIILYATFAVLGLLIVFIVMLSAFPELSLNTFGVRAYVAKYDTMEPTISPYDLVFVNRVDPDQLESGDLITFMADIDYNGSAEMVTYYILSTPEENSLNVFRVNPEGTQTPATALLTADDIVAGYSFSIPFMGRIVEFVSSPFGIAAILVNIGVITGVVILLRDNKKSSEKEETKES